MAPTLFTLGSPEETPIITPTGSQYDIHAHIADQYDMDRTQVTSVGINDTVLLGGKRRDVRPFAAALRDGDDSRYAAALAALETRLTNKMAGYEKDKKEDRDKIEKLEKSQTEINNKFSKVDIKFNSLQGNFYKMVNQEALRSEPLYAAGLMNYIYDWLKNSEGSESPTVQAEETVRDQQAKVDVFKSGKATELSEEDSLPLEKILAYIKTAAGGGMKAKAQKYLPIKIPAKHRKLERLFQAAPETQEVFTLQHIVKLIQAISVADRNEAAHPVDPLILLDQFCRLEQIAVGNYKDATLEEFKNLGYSNIQTIRIRILLSILGRSISTELFVKIVSDVARPPMLESQASFHADFLDLVPVKSAIQKREDDFEQGNQ
ncbi:uncharacterized protein L201_002669 [Kwoniella dendrophila CBS 6074]|uniref:Uncharacterized protein n=1 Tax=Kwoniella dendrophila CBS 6074 TaxID=1295534 RepID=A0AAX4JT37_9TREE